MTIYKILNAGQSIRRDARKRVWMYMGVPAIVAADSTLTLRADRVDERYYITFELRNAKDGKTVEAALPIATWTDMSALCPLYMLPRAARYDGGARPIALLMEFVMLDTYFATLAGVRA